MVGSGGDIDHDVVDHFAADADESSRIKTISHSCSCCKGGFDASRPETNKRSAKKPGFSRKKANQGSLSLARTTILTILL